MHYDQSGNYLFTKHLKSNTQFCELIKNQCEKVLVCVSSKL